MRKRGEDHAAISFPSWPKSDRAAWRRATRARGPFDQGVTVSHWRPATQLWAVSCYGRWLGFCAARPGWHPGGTPGSRITKSAVRDYAESLRPSVAPCTLATTIVALKVMAKALEPGMDWRWLERASNLLNRLAQPQRDKMSRMRPLEEVYQAAVSNLDKLLKTPLKSRADRIAYRDSLMLALIALRPLRIKNFSAIEIGRHLMDCGDDQLMIVFQPSEVKNKVYLEHMFPPTLLPFLGTYLDRVRPTFGTRSATNGLWLAYAGNPISLNEARYRIKLISKRLVGVDINPHLMRDIAATELAEACPEGIFTAAALLGHRNIKTTEDYYVRANRRLASRKINEVMAAILSAG